MRDEGRLSEVGAFRVDRAAALRKLMEYRFPDPLYYPIPWVAAAVASGATAIEVLVCRKPEARIELRFDGRPWSVGDLSDPYRALFDAESAALDRNRELAAGLLCALRLKPVRIEVRSRFLLRDTVLRLDSLDSESVETTAAPATDAQRTTITATWKPGTSFFNDELLAKFLSNCPIPVTIDGKPLKPASPPMHRFLSLRFQSGAASGLIGFASDESAARVDLVRYGVTLDTLPRESLALAVVRGFIRCDALKTDISCGKVLQDEAFDSALRALDDALEELVRAAAGRLSADAAAVGSALREPVFRMRWSPGGSGAPLLRRLRAALGLKAIFRATGLLERSLSDKIALASAMTAALRGAALHLRAQMLGTRSRLLNVLWNAPLLFDVEGLPLQLRELDEQRNRIGFVPCSERDSLAAAKCLIAWTPTDADLEFLREFYPSDLRQIPADASASIVARMGLGPRAGASADSEDLPHEMLAGTTIRHDGAEYHVGLSMSPHHALCRVRLAQEDEPDALILFPMSGLRPDVWFVDSRLQPACWSEAAKAVLPALPDVYARLVRAYDPRVESLRQMMIREHLLDLLVASWNPATRALQSNHWLADVPLFRGADARPLTLARISKAIATGECLLLQATMHPYRLQAAVCGFPDHVGALFAGMPQIKIYDNMARDENAGRPRAADPVDIGLAFQTKVLDALRGCVLDAMNWSAELARPLLTAIESSWLFYTPRPPTFRAEPAAEPEAPRVNVSPSREPRAEPSSHPSDDPEEALRDVLVQIAAATGFVIAASELRRIGLHALTGGLASRARDGDWRVNVDHPLARMLLGSGVPSRVFLPFLASAVLTAISRAQPELFAAYEAKFQAAVIAWASRFVEKAGRV
ncbi:MAG: hypothetical protein HY078_07145 [Elusimicrobia bacterium]|nr:hypothetical protein [Elusimicrobiota bacterium]